MGLFHELPIYPAFLVNQSQEVRPARALKDSSSGKTGANNEQDFDFR